MCPAEFAKPWVDPGYFLLGYETRDLEPCRFQSLSEKKHS